MNSKISLKNLMQKKANTFKIYFGLAVKNLPANAGDMGLIPGKIGKIPLRKKW